MSGHGPGPAGGVATGALLPGLLLAAAVAGAALALEAGLGAAGFGFVPPAMVMALLIGVALSGVATRPALAPGLAFAVKTLLRWAIALLGLRIALGDVLALGWALPLIVVAAMAVTVAASLVLARLLRLPAGLGALSAAANAVCGASATLATATVVPAYAQKERDVAFTVIMANAVSTLAMLAYPAVALGLGLSGAGAGAFLGGTIHDMAQVVGAGYAMGQAEGDAAVVVKLFRVFLLLPVVLALGWWLAGAAAPRSGEVPPAVPGFAVAFVLLALLNSLLMLAPAAAAALAPVKVAAGHLASAGLLLAIAALGLGTSLAALLGVGWRPVVLFMGGTLTLLAGLALGLSLIA